MRLPDGCWRPAAIATVTRGSVRLFMSYWTRVQQRAAQAIVVVLPQLRVSRQGFGGAEGAHRHTRSRPWP
jgi:hypothetical protein